MVAAAVTVAAVPIAALIFFFGRRVAPIDALPYRLGVAFGIVGAAVYVIALFRYLARYGEPRTNVAFALRGAIGLLAFLVVAAGATGALALINARFDRAPGKINQAVVLFKTRSPAKDTVVVRAESWKSADRILDFVLPGPLYDRITPRRTRVLVRTRPGAFGWEWIDGTPDILDVVDGPPTRAAGVAAGSTITPVENPARELVEKAVEQINTQRDEAVASLKRAIEIDPGYAAAYRVLDEALTPTREFDTLADYWSRLIALQPQNADGWEGRARARIGKKDMAGALDDADQGCRLGLGAACDTAGRLREAPSR